MGLGDFFFFLRTLGVQVGFMESCKILFKGYCCTFPCCVRVQLDQGKDEKEEKDVVFEKPAEPVEKEDPLSGHPCHFWRLNSINYGTFLGP